MAVPTSKTDRAAICRSTRRADARSSTGWISREATSNQVWDRRVTIPRRLNIGCTHRRVVNYFLLKVANRDIERASSQEIGGGVIKARFGELPIRGGAGEIR